MPAIINSGFDDPEFDRGPGLEVTSFTPGRFANAIQKNRIDRHALQAIREEATSSFVMDLMPDGSATLCRGWRYLFFNDGPEVHTMVHIREQLGYSGQWQSRGQWVQVDLTLDESVCERVGEYTNLVPNHASDWHLRCLPVAPTEQTIISTPSLVCKTTNVDPLFGEDEPHVVDGILPGSWIVLGAGNGLRIKWESVTESGPTSIQVEALATPLPTNAWEQAF
ncbi:MAG TPA: hypothetical protein VN844_07010 [Pyrinomonadaceae bacterium]|nr:hypothetical protein [Pyrinomonadaceae bacterium]